MGSGPLKGTKYTKRSVVSEPAIKSAAANEGISPLEYALSLMRDDDQSVPVRLKAAQIAGGWMYAAKPLGKKDQADEAAKTAGTGTEWGEDLGPRALN